MLDLFICHLNPSAMRRLAQRLEEESADPEIRRYCERILRVRSTGWTQGIFANFAAESMVPKGPEWGGGNWEIKTPMNIKDIPKWELAAEVMPYMRTDDGTIPSINTDHIGVYLGLIKGRGNVVEVREDSLMKYNFGNDIKTNEVQSSLATSIANKSNPGVHGGESRAGSLMGLEILSNKVVASNAVDEQTKAEEEFKKSLYGSAADGSSSDEEGGSKAKKLHIRIRDKPVSSTTVDVNKIKEATKQLGLPLGRTKSLTGSSPDLGLILPQPTPPSSGGVTAPTVSAPADLFGTELVQSTSVSQPAFNVAGGGAAARPIPEDFFQNTISSLEVAASLRPPGTYLSQMDPNSQKSENNKITPNLVAAAVPDVGLADGGVPPQATQQPPLPEYIGLPDGGIPPQTISQPPILQSQVPKTQLPLSTQPLDLSSLEAPGSGTTGKTPERPASPPKSVRPGLVSILFSVISIRTRSSAMLFVICVFLFVISVNYTFK